MYVIFVQFTTSLALVGYLFDSSGAGGSIDRFRKAAVKKAHYELLARKINPERLTEPNPPAKINEMRITSTDYREPVRSEDIRGSIAEGSGLQISVRDMSNLDKSRRVASRAPCMTSLLS